MKLNPENILIKDYTYELPQEKIAALPLPQRDASRLLVYKAGSITDEAFRNLPHYLPAGTTLIFNDTRVIEARLLFQKPTGGVIEVFCLEPIGAGIETAMQQTQKSVWKCLIGGASKWKPGQVLTLSQGPVQLEAHYTGKLEDGFAIEFCWQPQQSCFAEVLHAVGAIPLPPYIKRKAEDSDKERYQTVFSRHDGSVAAPTAALHFTPEVLQALAQKGLSTQYITLHVGAGTFKPVKSETIGGHAMHGEPFVVQKAVLQQLSSSACIVAVGTTSMRTLESLYWLGVKTKLGRGTSGELAQWEAYELAGEAAGISRQQSLQYLIEWLEVQGQEALHCRTSIIIVPGYDFKMVQGLVTNFHQPQSTLLLLIAAFAGANWRSIYQHALQQDYRFLSYGDSSLLWRETSSNEV